MRRAIGRAHFQFDSSSQTVPFVYCATVVNAVVVCRSRRARAMGSVVLVGASELGGGRGGRRALHCCLCIEGRGPCMCTEARPRRPRGPTQVWRQCEHPGLVCAGHAFARAKKSRIRETRRCALSRFDWAQFVQAQASVAASTSRRRSSSVLATEDEVEWSRCVESEDTEAETLHHRARVRRALTFVNCVVLKSDALPLGTPVGYSPWLCRRLTAVVPMR